MKAPRSSSLLVFFLIAIALIGTYSFYLNKYAVRESIRSDGYSYYVYLPAAFIYHDITMKYEKTLPLDIRIKTYLTEYPGKDYRISKMTAGVAVLMTPFFFAGHALAAMGDYPTDGYSFPYQAAIFFAAVAYFLAGLYFLRKSLLNFFSEKITAIALVIPFFLTNVINYVLWEPSMSHVYSFFLVSWMVYLTIEWHKKFKTSSLLGLLFVLGMITLVRPTNLLCALFPLLYNVNDKESWKRKTAEVFSHPIKILAGGIFFLIPIFLQLIIWKVQTGNWLVDSYVGEHFFFNSPHILEVLLGFRTGWLIYTPVMIFALTGFYFLFKRRYPFSWSVVLFFFLNLYLTSCWWCYWYGGAFGMRPFIDFYAIFLIPLTACLKELFSKKFTGIIAGTLLIFFGLLNVFQQYQFQNGLIHYAYMSPQAYAAVFGKLEQPDNFDLLLEPDDIEMARQGKPMRKVFRPVDLDIKIMKQENVSIQASNGKYLCAQADVFSEIVADRDHPYKWETFKLFTMEGDYALIIAWNGLYVTADTAGILRIAKFATKESPLFKMEPMGRDSFAFLAANGKYLTVDQSERPLVLAVDFPRNNKDVFIIQRQDYQY